MELIVTNTLMLFIKILFLTNVLSWEIPDAPLYSEKQCLKHSGKSKTYDKTFGRTETYHARLKRKDNIIEELSRQMEAMEERVVTLEKRVDTLNVPKEGGEEAVSKSEQDARDHKDITENHSKKLETFTDNMDRLHTMLTETVSTVSELSDQTKSLTNRVDNIDVWKTDVKNMDLPKIKQDAENAFQLYERTTRDRLFEKVGTLMQDVGNIVINITSVNNTVSELAHNVTAVVTKFVELDTWGKRIADTGDATRKTAEDGEKAAAENARNIRELSLEVKNTTSKMTVIDITMSTMNQSMNKNTDTLISLRNEIYEKELPMIKQNISDNLKLLEEARHNASASSRLLQDHILWSNNTYDEFKKHINESLKMDEQLKKEHDSVKGTVEMLQTVSETLSHGIENLKENVSSNVGKLETVAQTVGNITIDIATLNKTAEQLSSQLNVTKQSVESIAVWRTEFERAELPALKQDVDVVRQEVEQANRVTSKNRIVLDNHILWADTKYEEFQEHSKSTNTKMEEFTGKHATTESKLDGEELDGAMTKAVVDYLKGKSTLHDMSFLLTLLNIVVVVFLVMYVKQTLSSTPAPTPAPTPTATRAATVSSNDVQRGLRREEVYELSWTGPMEDSLCVVTFHAETELKHAERTRSVFESVQQPCPTINTRAIRCHADIQLLPGSRIFLVFVDFNERNVILEDPTKGLGDLRVTTVRSLWRFGADVTVIYCGDKGSMNLGSGLFNPDLGSIHRQMELTQLKKSDRILSIYNDFSKDQKEHCRNFINRLLKRKHTTSAD